VLDRQHQHSLHQRIDAVERNVATAAARYHQFAQPLRMWSTNLRVAPEQGHGFDDQRRSLFCGWCIGAQQKV